MTYNDTEASVNSGKPIELYDFNWDVEHWRFTSGPDEIQYLGNTYDPELISRGDVEITDNNFKNEMEISISRDNIFAQQFILSPLEGIVSVTIYRGHGTDFVIYWQGIISNFTFNSGEISITAKPRTSSMMRTGLRRKYQKLCNHALYGVGCQVNQESYKVASTIATIDRTTITSAIFATKADGWFTAGKIVVGKAERLITSHEGATITINRPITTAVAGNSFTAYAGCDHTRTACKDKFTNNFLNYGGQPWIPTKNPFSGDGII